MITAFSIVSADEVGEAFPNYVYGSNGLFTKFENKFSNKSYGEPKINIQIHYILESASDISVFEIPKSFKLGNYSPKSHGIRWHVPVTRFAFNEQDEEGRRRFILESVLLGVSAASTRLSKRFPGFRFSELESDILKIGTVFISEVLA